MRKLYSFFWDCCRMGDVEGLFIAEESEVDAAIGSQVYFGEILGKHSDISGTLSSVDLKVISDDQDKIDWLLDIIGPTVSGYNPLEYLADEAEDEDCNEWNEQQELTKHKDESYIEGFE